jgi:hypothetical protein
MKEKDFIPSEAPSDSVICKGPVKVAPPRAMRAIEVKASSYAEFASDVDSVCVRSVLDTRPQGPRSQVHHFKQRADHTMM